MKKRILHLLASNSYSGAENVVCTIINNNKDNEMYYCSPMGPIANTLKNRKIKYIPLKRLSPGEVKRVCRDNKIDIIHAHDYKASFVAGMSGFKGRIISQLHVNWEFNKRWNLYTFIYSKIMKRFSKIVVVSKEIMDDAVYVKKKQEKFEIITNVVDSKRVMIKKDEFETDKYDLIFVGRLTSVKQPEMVIEITKKLKEDYPKIRTCMIGDGELMDNCHRLIKEYGLEENIDMKGFIANPFPYIKNSKIALLPSLSEGLPMSVIECMILGVPVINSGVDGLATLFKEYPEFICETIDDYCEISKLIISGNKNLARDCQKIIKNAVDIKKYMNKINLLYEENTKK